MAGIPLHTASPINLNATMAADFRTTTAAPSPRPLPTSITANTTASAANSMQSAQPGAAPVPKPTSTAQYKPTTPPPTRTTASPPTGTRSSPPPPQPGQAPSPRSSSRKNSTKRPSYPEPPQPNAVPQAPYQPPTSLPSLQTSTRSTNYPLPSPRVYEPIRSIPPASVTSIATPNAPGATLDLSHPPGYQQNSSASFQDRPIEEVDPSMNKSHSPSPSRAGRGRGLLDTDPYETQQGGGEAGDESPIWEGVKSAVDWAKAAGKRLSVQAEESWKIVTGDE